jgi:hypothetical protein
MAKYDEKHAEALDKVMSGVDGATKDKMFGYPVYKSNGKMAISVKPEGVIAKVGEKRVKELSSGKNIGEYTDGATGRVWKDWVLITGSWDSHKDVFAEAIKFAGK